jgi:phosphatidylglycerophosphate synthase
MMGIYAIKPRFRQSLRGVEGILIRRGVHPDAITLSALGLSVLGGLALWGAQRWPLLLLLIVPVALGRTALNALDGMVAVDTGVARPWGEVLNEFSDRLADVALFTGVSFAPGSLPPLGAATMIVMLLSSYLGTAAKAAGGKREYSGIMGKADRMILLSVAAVLALLLPGLPVFTGFLALVLAGLCVTIVQRLRAIHAALESAL